MALDFQQAREQIKILGESAQLQEESLKGLREKARHLLAANALNLDELREKVELVVRSYDASLRCAKPAKEALDAHFPVPQPPEAASLLAADGSQIFMDRHTAVEYYVINIGSIQMRLGEASPPRSRIDTEVRFGERLRIAGKYPSEEMISLLRDVREREILAELAADLPAPVITLTDGPLELWGARGGSAEDAAAQGMDAYLNSLSRLRDLNAATAGYVDKPTEDYVVRLLEVASQPAEEARSRPLMGVRDVDLFKVLLRPGERSAVFEMQSRSASQYRRRDEALAMHFFYINIGRPNHAGLARVDTLGWVAEDQQKLDALHAVLIEQSRMLGAGPYPYLLHRAHETALVSLDEKKQLELMIEQEMRRRGAPGEASYKQSAKDLSGRRRYMP